MELNDKLCTNLMIIFGFGYFLLLAYKEWGVMSIGFGVFLALFILMLIVNWKIDNEMIGRFVDNFIERHKVMRMLRDDDNPMRVTRRRQRAKAMDKVKIYAFFIFAYIVAPIVGLVVGIWQIAHEKRDIGAFTIGVTVMITFRLWLDAIRALRETQDKEQATLDEEVNNI